MIDSHCHLNFKTLSKEIDQIINNAKKNNLSSILSINTNPNEFNDHFELIRKYNGIYISYGLHPCEINSFEQIKFLNFDQFCNNIKVIGIGETGLDFFHSYKHRDKQILSFEKHIEASLKYKLPLIIHQRNSEDEIMDILTNYKKNNLKIVFHCFTGSIKLLEFCIENHYFISLSGIITFKNSSKLRSVVKNIPLDLLLIETDSPFLAPAPMRGKQNEPSYIKYTAQYLSQFYEINYEEFISLTDNNFFKLFNKANKDIHL